MLGWELVGAENETVRPRLYDARAGSRACDWTGVAHPASTIAVGVACGEERAAMLAAGLGEALPMEVAVGELAVRMARLAQGAGSLPRHRRIGPVLLDLLHRDACLDTGGAQRRWLALHPREFALLWRLADAPGERVPRERLLAVAHHYELFGGVSPINAQNRALIAALEQELKMQDIRLPIYWGNRNWHPLLPDTIRHMAADGVQHALAFFTSAFSSYSGCRQYREEVARAQEQVGAKAPQVSLLRKFYNHPGFVHPNVENVRIALKRIPAERRSHSYLLFTAHSIPLAMAKNSMYEAQLLDACKLIADRVPHARWQLVYQSRGGPPSQPWLEPDVLEVFDDLKAQQVRDVVVLPIGFISDHMEVIYDLDTEAKNHAESFGINLVRAATVGTHPSFVAMIRELIVERMTGIADRAYLGTRGATHDVCPVNCCLPGARPSAGTEPPHFASVSKSSDATT